MFVCLWQGDAVCRSAVTAAAVEAKSLLLAEHTRPIMTLLPGAHTHTLSVQQQQQVRRSGGEDASFFVKVCERRRDSFLFFSSPGKKTNSFGGKMGFHRRSAKRRSARFARGAPLCLRPLQAHFTAKTVCFFPWRGEGVFSHERVEVAPLDTTMICVVSSGAFFFSFFAFHEEAPLDIGCYI